MTKLYQLMIEKNPILPYPKGELTHIASESKQKSLEEFR